jgi:hypothetical protein
VEFPHLQVTRKWSYLKGIDQTEIDACFRLAMAFHAEHVALSDAEKKKKKYILGWFPKGDLNRRWENFLRTAEGGQKEVHIDYKQWLKFTIEDVCWWCGHPSSEAEQHGIDRWDSNVFDYSLLNGVSSCTPCNFFKGKLNLGAFLSHLRMILLHHSYEAILPPLVLAPSDLNQILHPAAESICRTSQPIHLPNIEDPEEALEVWRRFLGGAAKSGRIVKINFREFWALISKPCWYCGRTPSQVKIGLDRVDSTGHYILDNLVPACTACNKLKNGNKLELFIPHLAKILETQGFTLIPKHEVKRQDPLKPFGHVETDDVKTVQPQPKLSDLTLIRPVPSDEQLPCDVPMGNVNSKQTLPQQPEAAPTLADIGALMGLLRPSPLGGLQPVTPWSLFSLPGLK